MLFLQEHLCLVDSKVNMRFQMTFHRREHDFRGMNGKTLSRAGETLSMLPELVTPSLGSWDAVSICWQFLKDAHVQLECVQRRGRNTQNQARLGI